MNISPASASLFQSQVLASLMNSPSATDGSWTDIFSLFISDGTQPGTSDPLSLLAPSSPVNQTDSLGGLSPSGRNLSLFDPESAYRMMTLINNDEVLYKVQFSELSQMQSSVSFMQQAGERMESISLSTDNASIKAQLLDFLTRYNSWTLRFNPDVGKGGLLADTQAAQASRFELEQNINNHFFGIRDGMHGMRDLGFTIDPATHLAALDETQLDATLASNRHGVVDTLQEFGTNFAKSASLLNSDGNFIPSQLGNLDRAIQFIASNRNSLQAEFGTGDAAKPSGQVAQALAAYNQTATVRT